jgi:small subunit ribosomal protein S17
VPGANEVETQTKTNKRNRKTLVGTVVSNKMEKTIVVQIERRKLHSLYKKYITRTKKIKAHDEGNLCQIGDLVKVIESRPLSKDKHWSLLEVLEKAK